MDKKKKIKTTVTLARDLWEESQISAIKSGITFTEVVSVALTKYLSIKEAAKKDKKSTTK
tara:strand:+ start:305 stop:484 length:180 start_codon:yes stop_codon:yes gene_type:complete